MVPHIWDHLKNINDSLSPQELAEVLAVLKESENDESIDILRSYHKDFPNIIRAFMLFDNGCTVKNNL